MIITHNIGGSSCNPAGISEITTQKITFTDFAYGKATKVGCWEAHGYKA